MSLHAESGRDKEGYKMFITCWEEFWVLSSNWLIWEMEVLLIFFSAYVTKAQALLYEDVLAGL